MFIAIDGGSVGYQIGGSSTDLIMLFMNEHALHSLLSDKFKLGADASVAAGPVGRKAAASTDLKLNAEILSYSRSKGIFAGVSLDGAVVQADKSGDQALYGDNVDRHDILDGKVPVPDSRETPDPRTRRVQPLELAASDLRLGMDRRGFHHIGRRRRTGAATLIL